MEPLNAANPYGATLEDVLAGETFTGEALMTYIATRISSLDEDIQQLIGQQQLALAKKQYINQVKDWAAGLEHGAAPSAGGPGSTAQLASAAPAVGTTGGRSAGTSLARDTQGEPSTSNGSRGYGESYQQQTNAASDPSSDQATEANQGEPNTSTGNGPRGYSESYQQQTNAASNPDANQSAVPGGSFPPGSAELGDLPAGLEAAFNEHCGTSEGVTEETLKAFTAKLDSVLDEINGASELNMIRLQQLMGQRQVCIQLTTNLLSKLNAGAEAIVANCR